jgi:hypothetical protein
MRKLLMPALLGILLATGSVYAEDVIVRTRPPKALVEHRGVAPGRDHVWVAGYHRWNGTAHVWEPGRWELPPHPHAVWIAPRWVHRNGGYLFVEGRWK